MASSPPAQSLLVTGGSGFFGRSILDAHRRGLLRPLGFERVVALARQASRLAVEAPQLTGDGVELVDADVLCLDSLYDADVVIHAAASSDARRYRRNAAAEARIIVDGTHRVCDVVAKAAHAPRFLYVSSGAVYGRQPARIAALAEDAPTYPDADQEKAAYANAKREAEAIVCRFAAESRVPTRIARCFTFVGPWLPCDAHFAIGNFIGNALRGEPIVVRARHEVVRSYLHADDLSLWLVRLAAAAGDRCDVFNVGSDEAVALHDLAAIVAAAGGVGVAPPAARDEPGRQRPPPDRYIPDVRKARRELGLDVTIPLREAVERTLRALAEPPTAIVRSARQHAGAPR